MTIFKTIILLTAFSIGTFSLEAKTLIVGVSPFFDKTTHKQQVIELLKFASNLDAGDKLIFINAYELSEIGVFSVPDDKRYKSAKSRLNKNGSVVSALMKLTTPQFQSMRPSTQGAVKVPQFLSFLSEHYSQYQGDILILGAPFYDDPKEPAYAMKNGFFPSDSHILVKPSQSLFGTKGQEALLNNWRIHWAFGASQAMNNTNHHHYVRRFWSLYIENLGGELASFDKNLDLVLKRAWQSAKPLSQKYQLKRDNDRLQMLRLRISHAKPQLWDRIPSSNSLNDEQLSSAKNVEIAIRWTCACDIDLYARGNPNAEIISFSNKNTVEGWYFKDIGRTGKTERVYETIEFFRPIDLTKMQIAAVFYSGVAADGVRGDVRLAIDGEVFSSRFIIAATKGNGVKGVKNAFAENSFQAAHITFIDPIKIVKG